MYDNAIYYHFIIYEIRYLYASQGNRVFDGNATDVGFTSLDGDDIVLFEDLDGSVTGSAGNFVVKPLPIHMTEQCEEIDNWKMAVCPHPFGQVRRFFCVFDFYF